MNHDNRNSGRIALLAPLSGILIPIEQVPDAVFAQKMAGDGVSLDPVDQTLLAPCDGRVFHIHRACHAVTILTQDGVKVLLHIGLDTVNLKGKGFTPLVQTGDSVRGGDPLIGFDADFIAQNAKSLLTQIVIANGEPVSNVMPCSGIVKAGIDPIMFFTLATDSPDSYVLPGTAATASSETIQVPNPTGLHARPAAMLANIARTFSSEILLLKGDQQANAKSVVSIMALDVGYSEMVRLNASGDDAEAAVEALSRLLRDGLGDFCCSPYSTPVTDSTITADSPLEPRPANIDPDLLTGVAASPGLAAGKIFQVRHAEFAIDETAAAPPAEERKRLECALAEARLQMDALRASIHGERSAGNSAIFAAHQELLCDPELLDIAWSLLANGKKADFAWHQAFSRYAERLAGMSNQLIAARANDLRDVGGRVLKLLTGAAPEIIQPPEDSILVAEELTPSEAASLDRGRVRGFCTTLGGATSHVAIIARSMDIPSVVGIDPGVLDLKNGILAVIDGGSGTLRLNPSPETVAEIRARQEQLGARKVEDLLAANQPAITLDNHRLDVVANIGGLADARNVIEAGGEGVGLLRSEFLFMERSSAPDEEEQFESYRAIVEALDGRPLIIRTLDVGGDKPLTYLPIPKEENPFLGERGLRVGLARPEMFRTQLRAILRASGFGRISVMFPMVALLQELRDARAMLEEERARLAVAPVEVGIMVEIPAAAVMAAQFAREVDFFSIGTNDLTQYTLAMDRGHPGLAPGVDALNPAVLRLIDWTVQAAHANGKRVGVCGGIAGDPLAVPLLIGLGVDELSAALPAIPGVKALIRNLKMDECRKLARSALEQDTGVAVRAISRQMSQ